MGLSARWDEFKKVLIECLKCNGFQHKDGLFFSSDNGRSFFVLPLCKIEDLRDFRKKNNDDFYSPAIFLISGEHENPYKDNRCLNKDILTEYFGNPKFGNIIEAIFFAEINNLDHKNDRVLDATSSSFWDDLLKVLNDNTIDTFLGKYRGFFYKTFVDYYFLDDIDIRKDEAEIEIRIPKVEAGTTSRLYETGKVRCKDLIERAESAYCRLNAIEYIDLRHRVENEVFRAPVPFPLQELIDAKNDIRRAASSPLKLLLIDNKRDKLNPLIKLIKDFDLVDLFALEMIGENDETFDHDRFKSIREESVTKTYANEIYREIGDAHFILLDFFLNRENTYLAFDFIKDIAEIKKKEGDYSTTWYFITSAVYDSVVKYSQSGLLAEYYESAVVNAGDDPTNKKRQIIFVYKLLTFIQARIRSFKGFHDSVIDSKFLNCTTKECENTQCLIENQNLFRKYLAEFGEIIKIFPGKETEEKQFRETVELLDSTVNQFLWLPEADWPMIQRQIEFVNSKLTGISGSKNMEFSCSHIKCEIEKRSNIY